MHMGRTLTTHTILTFSSISPLCEGALAIEKARSPISSLICNQPIDLVKRGVYIALRVGDLKMNDGIVRQLARLLQQ